LAVLTARKLPDAGAGPAPGAAVLLDAVPRVAYCVPGRPATIVLSSGALAVLDPAQLTAVLAHERAHLAGRHHLLISLTRGLSASFPAVPLFTQGPGEVARLAEMCADDATLTRVQRLLDPPRRARRARCGVALMTVTLWLAVMPVLVAAFAGVLTAPGVVAG
jgi:Zn-dependent protease with chaperone function